MQTPIIRAEKVEKYYAQPSDNRIQVIVPTDLEIVEGQIVALLRPSGSGKSTLLRIRNPMVHSAQRDCRRYGDSIRP